MRIKHWIKRIRCVAGSALMVGLTMGEPDEQQCYCPMGCCEKPQTADGNTPQESPNRAGDLDVLDEKYSCRCEFIGETAEAMLAFL